jgi:hypothetical protein
MEIERRVGSELERPQNLLSDSDGAAVMNVVDKVVAGREALESHGIIPVAEDTSWVLAIGMRRIGKSLRWAIPSDEIAIRL